VEDIGVRRKSGGSGGGTRVSAMGGFICLRGLAIVIYAHKSLKFILSCLCDGFTCSWSRV
jgi:hypothetical protein